MRRSTVFTRSLAEARTLALAAFVLALASALMGVRVEWFDVPQPVPVEDSVHGGFSICHAGGGANCVVDGDTFWMEGEKIRMADIDTPETHPPRCAREAALGEAATERLQALLNAGPVTLEAIDRDTDRYGRKLRVVTRGGVSLGDALVAEGLARRYEGGRREGWCGAV